MQYRRIASYDKRSKYHDSFIYCKMKKSWTDRKDIVCDFPATSRDGYCDFHQKMKSNQVMKPQPCEHRGCDRSFCGKLVKDSRNNYVHAFCRLHFSRYMKSQDMNRGFNERAKVGKDVINIGVYVEGDEDYVGIN